MTPPPRRFRSTEEGFAWAQRQALTSRQYEERIKGMSASDVLDGGHLARLRELAASRSIKNPQKRNSR
jgi:hypothetical protein